MPAALGRTTWAIPEGYIPRYRHGPAPELTSHETAVLLNTGDEDAHVRTTIYFAGLEPVGPYRHRSRPAHATRPLQCPQGSRADPAWQRLLQRPRVRCPDRGAAHAPRFAAGRGDALLSTIAYAQ